MLNDEKTIELLKTINSVNENIVFVGGISELIQGKRISTKDIDICVLNLDGFDKLGELKQWKTESPVSVSGNRGGIENNDFILDIFIEYELPNYIEIDGLKFVTLEFMISRYEMVIKSLTNPKQKLFRDKLINNLENLKNNI